MPTEGTPSGFGEDLRLPEAMREELRVPFGRLVSGGEFIREVDRVRSLVTVGDYCTFEALKASKTPRVAIIDLKIKRARDERVRLQSPYKRVIKVKNPAGHISREAWLALREAYSSDEEVMVLVDGEEDLLALPAIALGREGDLIAYGLPDRGVVLVDVNDDTRSRAESVLSRMEVVNGD